MAGLRDGLEDRLDVGLGVDPGELRRLDRRRLAPFQPGEFRRFERGQDRLEPGRAFGVHPAGIVVETGRVAV